MTILLKVLIALHILSWVGALALTDPIAQKVRKGASHAVASAIVTGILIVGVAEMRDADLNHIKIAIKLVVALVAAVMAFKAAKQEGAQSLARPVFALIGVNILIAILW